MRKKHTCTLASIIHVHGISYIHVYRSYEMPYQFTKLYVIIKLYYT